jgi:hypothetical protein
MENKSPSVLWNWKFQYRVQKGRMNIASRVCNAPSFQSEELLTTCPIIKLKDHPISAVRYDLFLFFKLTSMTGRFFT